MRLITFLRTTTLVIIFINQLSVLRPLHIPSVPPKDWNFMVYMSNNNNLHRFGVQNFRQMVKVGSTDSMNIILQMDEFGASAISRFYIEKSKACMLQTASNTPTSFSGTLANLVDFSDWSINSFKAGFHCLTLWNHGSGIKDPDIWGKNIIRHRDSFFVFNNETGLFNLDRSLKNDKKWFSAMNRENKERGIAFNDATETYLTNQDLKNGLDQISSKCLLGKKIDVLAMDACHMAMVEIASQIKNSAHFMVASEEVEPGSGYNYIHVLDRFIYGSKIQAKDLAYHIVQSYKLEYEGALGDYTQSAVDLSLATQLEKNINTLSLQLIAELNNPNSTMLKTLVSIRGNKKLTTEFFDTDYIDFSHFCKSLIAVAPPLIKSTCFDALFTLNKMIIANVAGPDLPNAFGLSIYFPTQSIHASYYKTEFAKVTAWPKFLELFIQKSKGNRPLSTYPSEDEPTIYLKKTKKISTQKKACPCKKSKTMHDDKSGKCSCKK